MMCDLDSIPELRALDGRDGWVRIPPELDVPLTNRVRALIDTPAFRRLAHISQLGLVSLVYPAAHHSRFEHSLGVYRLAILYLKQLAGDTEFTQRVSKHEVEVFIASSLLHDIGHWPFCHSIEDLQLEDVPRHESFSRFFIRDTEIATILQNDWHIDHRECIQFLTESSKKPSQRILQSMLSGPIDVDKMDYLMRDSLHAGVPYGRNFDQARLIRSLCLNKAKDELALSGKGRTAAEMMVFARYVMFSEVYWHHTVRAATAMLQRAFFELKSKLNLESLFRKDEKEFIVCLLQKSSGTSSESLLQSLFGSRRRIYKRLQHYSYIDSPEIYELLARRPYEWLCQCSAAFTSGLAKMLKQEIRSDQVLFDAPPTKLEVEFKVDVHYKELKRYRTMGEVSPVVRTLAETQFDRYVKQVRIFVDPDLCLKNIDDHQIHDLLHEVVQNLTD